MKTMEEAVIKRVLPHSTEAEQSVIGSMLMNRDAILAAAELIDGRDFYNSQYGLLFDAMTELNNEGQPVDPVTLQARLIEKGAPPEVSGLEYIADLISAVPTSANVRYYAKIVADRALSRRIIKMNEELMNACYAGTESVDEIVDRAEKAVFSLAENGRAEEVPPIDEVMVSVLKRISAAARMKGAVTGVPTGFADLD